jgi:hypothetical protein
MSNQNLPKHQKYKSTYKPNDFFWGLGVEHETYIESQQVTRRITESDVRSLQRPERYSVPYYKSYKPPALLQGISNFFTDISHQTDIPILLNSHAFTRTDLYCQPETTYEKQPKPNPNYSGESLHAFAQKSQPWFKEEFDHIYLFDGDTVEFTTLNFYKVTPRQVVQELEEQHMAFEANLNGLPWQDCSQSRVASLAPFCIQRQNHPFATYTTNLANISMFNNGTIHVNITLPTQLDASAQILDWGEFERKHRALARLIQWFEPFMIAVYGTPDPFSRCQAHPEAQPQAHPYKFGASSQRLAVSRYIGLGTYDTTRMPTGKILQTPRNSLPWEISASKCGWYPDDPFWAYEPLDQIGLDINFNKHQNHGLELRFFDALPIKSLEEVLETIVALGEWTEKRIDRMLLVLSVPQTNDLWKKLAKGALESGAGFTISGEDFDILVGDMFGCRNIGTEKTTGPVTLRDAYYRMLQILGRERGVDLRGVEEVGFEKKLYCCGCW